jgi:hypothetical protein
MKNVEKIDFNLNGYLKDHDIIENRMASHTVCGMMAYRAYLYFDFK